MLESDQKIILIRSIFLFYPLIVGVGLACIYRVSYRQLTGIFLAFIWCFCGLLIINPLNIYFGWWTFTIKGGVFWNTPVDLVLGWAILWSTVPNIVGRRWNVFLWASIIMTTDILLMPLAKPAVLLQPGWLWGELICVVLIFIPSRILAQSTFLRNNLYSRSFQQLFLFFAIFIVLIPAAIVETTGGRYPDLSDHSPLYFLILLLSLFFLSLPGLSAFQEFAVRGRGTPIPLDPPKHIVCTGPYSYVANPMQTSVTLFFVVMVIALENFWFYFAGFTAVVFSLGISSWNEDKDLKVRFGERWDDYRSQVRMFFPRLRPMRNQFAEIYLDFSDCDACKVLWDWIQNRNPVQLRIRDIAFYHGKNINGMVYKDHDGYEETGVKALARVMEHIHLGWAFVGIMIRIPGLSVVFQFLFDIVAPHAVCSSMSNEKARGSSKKWYRLVNPSTRRQL